MSLRKNFFTIDNATSIHQGIVCCCKFDKTGDKLAIADTEGNISFYSTQDQQNIQCKGQLSTNVDQNQIKNFPKIKSLQWMSSSRNQSQILIHQKDFIKIFKVDFQHIFSSQLDEQKNRKMSINLQELVSSKLITNFQIKAQKIDLSQSSSKLLITHQGNISIQDIQNGITTYQQNLICSSGLPISKRLDDQTRLQYQERTEAQKDYWESIDFITQIKFQKPSDSIVGYSNKFGVINIMDIRSHQNNSPIIKLQNSNTNSLVQSCLQIPSDFCFLDSVHEIISRDFLYVYVFVEVMQKWDIRKPKTYLHRQSVYPSINTQICQLYQQGQIFNRFSLKSNSNGSSIFTTNFQHSFHEIQLSHNTNFRYRLIDDEITPEIVKFQNEIPPLSSTKVLRNFDYSERKNLVCSALGNQIQLFRSTNTL